MTTGKALNGKPYAGNPHVRFDEGEVASAATPRRGSLLYKKLIVVAFSSLVAFMASADVLYWMVGDSIANTAKQDDSNNFAALYVTGDGLNPDPTALMTVTGGQVFNMYDPDGGTVGFDYNGIEAYNSAGYKFYIEILADGDYKGSQTSKMSYTDISQYIFANSSIPTGSMIAGFGGGTTSYNVPEPTSGLLFLIGGMLLGLKRRRQQV